MSIVEFIPLNKGNQIILNDTNIITLGRTPQIGCLDNRISRNHAQLFLKSDGTLWLKPLHHNPTFYKTKTNQIVTLTKNKEYQLYNNAQFGLLPDEYFYRVSIKLNDKEIQTLNSSTIPKSPVQNNEILTIENHNEEISQSQSNVNLHTTRILPNWISDSSITTSKHEKELNDDKPTTTSLVKQQTYREEKKNKQLVYDDDNDDDGYTTVVSLPAQSDTPNKNDLTANNQTASSSTVVDSSQRERCPYGESCYRKNLTHREEVSHPGDPDWEIKENDKNKTKPECPFGYRCYRTNPDHLNEYHHPKKRCIEIKTTSRTTKRKANDDDDDDDDDDGLPNEYDHNDSFIDDEGLASDTTNDEEESYKSDGDTEWKPVKKSRYTDETDDASSEESDRELRDNEAAEFTKGSVTKKPRIENDDDTD